MHIPILTTRRPDFGGQRDQKWLFNFTVNSAGYGFDIFELQRLDFDDMNLPQHLTKPITRIQTITE
jgi:hypothetical protein